MEPLDLDGTFIFLDQDFYFFLDILITNNNHEKANIALFEKLKFSFGYTYICYNAVVMSSSTMSLGSKWIGFTQNKKKIERIFSHSKDLKLLWNAKLNSDFQMNQLTFTLDFASGI